MEKYKARIGFTQRSSLVIGIHELDEATKRLELLFSETDIDQALTVVAGNIERDLSDDQPVFICVLNGAMMVYGRLMTKLSMPLQMDYAHATRYGDAQHGGDIVWHSYPSCSLEGRTVVLVDDVLEGGVTLSEIAKHCYDKGATMVKTMVLVEKNMPRLPGGVKTADYSAFVTENDFLVGFGLDYKGFLRNTNQVFVLKNDDGGS